MSGSEKAIDKRYTIDSTIESIICETTPNDYKDWHIIYPELYIKKVNNTYYVKNDQGVVYISVTDDQNEKPLYVPGLWEIKLALANMRIKARRENNKKCTDLMSKIEDYRPYRYRQY